MIKSNPSIQNVYILNIPYPPFERFKFIKNLCIGGKRWNDKRGYSSAAYGWGADTLFAADWVSAAVAHSWTAPSLWAFRHSISVSTSILTTWVVYACIWTHLHFIYCIMFFYFRLYGWLLCFSVYVFVLDDMDLLLDVYNLHLEP